jgi:hypothetical protein
VESIFDDQLLAKAKQIIGILPFFFIFLQLNSPLDFARLMGYTLAASVTRPEEGSR